jgi:hypothetical protein
VFKRRTVFIVGAGASQEYGLPVGSGLLTNISELFRTQNVKDGYGRTIEGWSNDAVNIEMHQLARDRHQGKESEVRALSKQLANSLTLAQSIDNYLYTHAHNKLLVDMGKSAIVYALLSAEKKSSLAGLNASSLKVHSETWLSKFAQKLFAEVTLETVDDVFQNVEVISFNYDRCVRHFMRHALASYFGLSTERAETIADKLKIHFPYGSLGSLGELPFGRGADGLQFSSFASNIRTFMEGEASATASAIRHAMSAAEAIVFLGFGFHKQNMKLLRPWSYPSVSAIYATAFKLSDYNRQEIKDAIAGTLLHPSVARPEKILQPIPLNVLNKTFITGQDLKAAHLFDEFGLGL